MLIRQARRNCAFEPFIGIQTIPFVFFMTASLELFSGGIFVRRTNIDRFVQAIDSLLCPAIA